ncbi:MAG: reverse transcriptase family protein [Bacteroidota bacterium]
MSDALPLPDDFQPQTRQQLYDQLRTSSRDELILAEMKRLGFWAQDEETPSVPEQIIKRRGELQRELRSFLAEKRLTEDRERLLKEERKVRMAEALQRRQETRERHKAERAARAAAWAMRQQREIVYLGADVSAGLNHTEPNLDRLSLNRVPVYHTAWDLAQAMGISLSELRFLTFTRRVSRLTHYRPFLMAKKSGGTRRISAPMPRLKRAQRWVLDTLLSQVPLHDAAHGFVSGRSIVTNAQPHVGADVVVNMDLRDFFPTVTYPRVKGLYRGLGYSEQVATVLALLCTEPLTDAVEMDGRTYHVARGERLLPQGAPTSPALTNILCRGLDNRLEGMARSLGLTYTRYADDLTFSGSGEAAQTVTKLLWRSSQIIADEGFTLHPDKLRIMRKGRRQEVTGLVVNDKLSLDRRTLRRFRATLYQVERDGPAGKHWGETGADVLAALHGYAHFIMLVDAKRGLPFVTRTQALIKKHRYQPAPGPQRSRYQHARTATELTSTESEPTKPASDAPDKPWWKLW